MSGIDQRIILANDSRLLREMLNRILAKAENLDVVLEIADHEDLPAAIQQMDVEWVILTMPSENDNPGWIDAYLEEHPLVKIMTVSPDGSWVKMKWLDKRERELSNLSLPELIKLLEGDLITEEDTTQEVA